MIYSKSSGFLISGPLFLCARVLSRFICWSSFPMQISPMDCAETSLLSKGPSHTRQPFLMKHWPLPTSVILRTGACMASLIQSGFSSHIHCWGNHILPNTAGRNLSSAHTKKQSSFLYYHHDDLSYVTFINPITTIPHRETQWCSSLVTSYMSRRRLTQDYLSFLIINRFNLKNHIFKRK